MNKTSEKLELLWEDLLSHQPETIQAAFASLDPSDQKAVLTHLQRMVSESGWQPEQRLSARAALDVLLS
jgi:NADH:ubiquinone oxidoreductase subunit E